MLRPAPRHAVRRARARLHIWWHRGPSRLRLRRQMLVCTVPAALILAALGAEVTTTVLTGQDAVSDFAHHDIDALRADVATLSRFNIVDPARVAVAAADLAVLEGRLDAAENHFTDALDHTPADQSCPILVNLELLRETRGDLAAATGDTSQAEQRYNAAQQTISAAPPGCFTDNTDPNPDRRQIRREAAARLTDKIKALHLPPAPPPAPAQTLTPQPPPTSLTSTQAPPPPNPGATSTPTPPPPPPPAPGGGGLVIGPAPGQPGGPGPLNDVTPDRIPVTGTGSAPPHHLPPGDPLDRLRNTLADADATGASTDTPN